MATEKTIMTNVLKKLSALRVTLQPEEQRFLDKLVTNIADDEVEAHRVMDKNLPTKNLPTKIVFDQEKAQYKVVSD
jgi:hypothetical protein